MISIGTSPSAGPGSAEIIGFHEPDTGSIQYLVIDPDSGKAAVVDPVLNFDPSNARTSTDAAEEILRVAQEKGVEIAWILDTHPHADHLTAAAWLQERTGARTAIGEKIEEIAGIWRRIYGMPEAFAPDQAYDRLLANGEVIRLGTLDIQVMLSPGHTLGSVTYLVGSDAAMVHDTLMHVDVGTSRADFPGGDAAELWESLQRILSLPRDTRLFVGHDYGAPGRSKPAWVATVAEHLERNPHVGRGCTRETFLETRTARDATLPLPDRMLHALQVNLRGGRLPEAEADGRSYFRIPANYM